MPGGPSHNPVTGLFVIIVIGINGTVKLVACCAQATSREDLAIPLWIYERKGGVSGLAMRCGGIFIDGSCI
jgi:hypothetical protein